MLRGFIWWRDGSHVFLTGPHRIPEGAVPLGVSVLDDEGIIRAWEIMTAQAGTTLVPTEGAQAWINGLPFRELSFLVRIFVDVF